MERSLGGAVSWQKLMTLKDRNRGYVDNGGFFFFKQMRKQQLREMYHAEVVCIHLSDRFFMCVRHLGSVRISGEDEILAIDFRKSEEEELNVSDTSKLCSEGFDLGIE